ncbi:MAG: chemotaxis protein CheA [Bacteriovoracaceae bacterium]|nr:chemotaxis protein CheA [Bacteriovoracaceae bacterium]
MGEFEDEMRVIFCDEATDLLLRWESVALELSKKVKIELLQEIFRIAHNLKGGSRAIGLVEFGNFVHKVEDGITLLRDEKVPTSIKCISLLLKAQKILMEWITATKEGTEYTDDTSAFLAEYQSAMKTENEDKQPELVLDSDMSAPPSQDLFSETPESTESSKVVEIKKISEPPISSDIVATSVKTDEPVKLKNTKTANQESIRVPANKLDELAACIGELSIHQSIMWHLNSDLKIKNKIFLNSLQVGQKLTKELYDRALGLRMQPIQSLFQRLERNILDLSQNLNKTVKVILEGSDVELDKTVLDKMVDPLTHIVRNAIDHGIEKNEERLQKGKDANGTIKISAKQDTSGVVITVSDDGKGLNRSKIISKAVEKKLISHANNMSDEQVLKLILLPGFSTADKITDVSGRGVGMDVVSKAIEELRGKIHIESVENSGSNFNISLPTSVSIIDGLIVKLTDQLYVVPVDSIEEVINLADCEFDNNKSMIYLRDQVIPIQKLASILKHSSESNHPKNNEKNNESGIFLIAKRQQGKVAFLVDAVLGQQQIVVRPLNQNISGLVGIMGGTILGNGEPGLIIDMHTILKNYVAKFEDKELSA